MSPFFHRVIDVHPQTMGHQEFEAFIFDPVFCSGFSHPAPWLLKQPWMLIDVCWTCIFVESDGWCSQRAQEDILQIT
jgi:hypothetical protein